MEEEGVQKDQSVKKGEIVRMAVYAALGALAFDLRVLFMLGKGAKCELMAGTTLAACLFGGVSLMLPLVALVGEIVLLAKR